MNLKLINEVFQRHYFDVDVDDNPWIINCGWCYNWAYAAYFINGGTLCSGYHAASLHHAFIKLDGKYYDAEVLEGVEDWKKLPSFRGFCEESLTMTEHSDSESFWLLWQHHGAEADLEVLIQIGEICPSIPT